MEDKKYEIEGLSELMSALDELPKKVSNQVIRNINSKVGRKFIVNVLKDTLPYSDQSLKGIKVINDRDNPTGVFAGVSSSAFWLRFVDYGTVERKTKKGYNRGSIVGNNLIDTTILNQVEPIINYINEEIGNEIIKVLERKIKRVNKLNNI
jgi:hypothetical protein